MGIYVNPSNMSKEDWLMQNGTLVGQIGIDGHDSIPTYNSFKSGTMPVVLVSNGYFTAAAVCDSQNEYVEFTDLEDGRDRIIFSVDVEKLKTVSDLR
jgi:hypothetical protein